MAYEETRKIDEQGWAIRCAEAAALSHAGYTIAEIGQWFGKSEALMFYWGQVHPPFREALKMHTAASDGRVVHKLYSKALEGDTTAMIFWLKNRQPNDWRDKRDIDIGGGAEITVTDNRRAAMAVVHLMHLALTEAATGAPLIEGSPNDGRGTEQEGAGGGGSVREIDAADEDEGRGAGDGARAAERHAGGPVDDPFDFTA